MPIEFETGSKLPGQGGEWRKWIDLVVVGTGLASYTHLIHESPKSLQTLVALACSTARWHPDAQPRGGTTVCGLCSLFFYTLDPVLRCKGCPLAIADKKCFASGSIHSRWHLVNDPSTKGKYANQMYLTLYNLYREEYNLCKEKGLI